MASQSLPIPLPKVHERTQAHLATHAPSLKVVFIAFVALLILFLWLHLILAEDIATTGREIQTQTEVLHGLERDIAVLQRRIAEPESQHIMSQRAEQAEYELRKPIYVTVSRPLSKPEGEAAREGMQLPTNGTASGASPIQASLGDILVRESDIRSESEVTPWNQP